MPTQIDCQQKFHRISLSPPKAPETARLPAPLRRVIHSTVQRRRPRALCRGPLPEPETTINPIPEGMFPMKAHEIGSRWLPATMTALLLFTLLGCEARISQKNFDRVQKGMSMAEATAILGEPTTSSGLDVGLFSGAHATWEGEKGTIMLQFLNGKVALKTFTRDKPSK